MCADGGCCRAGGAGRRAGAAAAAAPRVTQPSRHARQDFSPAAAGWPPPTARARRVGGQADLPGPSETVGGDQGWAAVEARRREVPKQLSSGGAPTVRARDAGQPTTVVSVVTGTRPQPCAPARGAGNPADSRPPGPTRTAPTATVDTDGRTNDGRARPSRAPRGQKRGSDVTRGRGRVSYWPSRAPPRERSDKEAQGGEGGRPSAPGLAHRARARTGRAEPPTTTAAAAGLPLVRGLSGRGAAPYKGAPTHPPSPVAAPQCPRLADAAGHARAQRVARRSQRGGLQRRRGASPRHGRLDALGDRCGRPGAGAPRFHGRPAGLAARNGTVAVRAWRGPVGGARPRPRGLTLLGPRAGTSDGGPVTGTWGGEDPQGTGRCLAVCGEARRPRRAHARTLRAGGNQLDLVGEKHVRTRGEVICPVGPCPVRRRPCDDA